MKKEHEIYKQARKDRMMRKFYDAWDKEIEKEAKKLKKSGKYDVCKKHNIIDCYICKEVKE